MTVVLEAPTPVPTTRLRGMEAQHVWTSPSGTALTLNDHTTFPHLFIDAIEGRHSAAERGDGGLKHDPAVARMGEIVRRVNQRGKTENWRGKVRAQSLEDLREFEYYVGGVLSEPGVGTMQILPFPGSDDPSVAFEAEVASRAIGDEQTLPPWQYETEGWEREFTAEFRLPDPRYYEEVDRTATTATLVSTDGLAFPAAFPAAFVGPDAMAGAVTVSTLNAWVDPIIDLAGYAPNPVIVNDTIGQRIEFAGLTIWSGQTLRLDFAERTMTIDGEPVDRSYVDWSVSGWWDAFVPGLRDGDNLIRYLPEGANAGTLATVQWRNALSG